jgi:putative heme-binding domain-containing protein
MNAVFTRTFLPVVLAISRATAVLVLACGLGASRSSLGAVGENALPQADWISATPSADGGQRAYFRKTFTTQPGLVKAVLLGAADQRMTVFVNGNTAAEIAGFERAASIDVTRHLREGQNVLAIRVENSDGLAAFRLMLELATMRGRQSWVASDATWLSSTAEVEGWTGEKFNAPWSAAISHGPAGLQRWGDSFHATKSVDAYNSWMLATGAAQATDPATFNVLPGYRVELLRSAQPEEGSWVALAFDPKGRITIAREQRGLLRMTLGRDSVEKVEVIEDTLLECRGLLYAYDALYANANNSKGLYRLRDTDGDDQFDEKKLLLEVGGGVGHGRNQLRLGPDGLIYLAQGNDVNLPANIANDSPLRHTAADQLFPLRWGEHGTTKGILPPHGYILQTDRDGSFWRVIAGGLRNQLDVDFNEDGEMFTYDADNERDISTPWYKPTRVLHVTSGAEFGWRIGAGKLPAYLPDTLPSAVDIGVGSPCGVEFGTRSKFPPRYRRALFIADWAYGRIVAIHLQPEGASYRGSSEPFITGRPLNVTDMTFGPDGAMYFTTGGRRTQSGLYRVSYAGAREAETVRPPSDSRAAELRKLRRKLEELHGRQVKGAVETAWPHLDHPDQFVRYAARVALEAQPLHEWQEKAFTEDIPARALSALLALARVAPAEMQGPLLARLRQFDLNPLNAELRLGAVRICQVACTRMERPDAQVSEAAGAYFEPFYPARNTPLNHELCRLLTYLGSPAVLEKTIALARDSRSSEDLLHYLWHLRQVKDGWNLDHRRIAFDALVRAEQLQGAREYYQALRDIRKDFSDALTDAERDALREAMAPTSAPAFTMPAIDWSKYRYGQSWKLQDFSPEDLARGGSMEQGREVYAAAQCIQCHRFGNDPGGTMGPDLGSIASRFGRRDLLQHTLEPSAAIDDKFRHTVVTLKNGNSYAGLMQEEDEKQVRLASGATPDDVVVLEKTQIVSRESSPVSPMPPGLLNILSKEQIADLLAYLESGVNQRRASEN